MPHIAITMFPGRDDKTKEALAGKMKETLVKELGAVSYTHLDVYKRQIPGRIYRLKHCGRAYLGYFETQRSKNYPVV